MPWFWDSYFGGSWFFCYCKAWLSHIVDKSFINCINSHICHQIFHCWVHLRATLNNREKKKKRKIWEAIHSHLGSVHLEMSRVCLSIELYYACHMRTHAFFCSAYSWIGRYYPPALAWLFPMFPLVFVAFASLWPEYSRETTQGREGLLQLTVQKVQPMSTDSIGLVRTSWRWEHVTEVSCSSRGRQEAERVSEQQEASRATVYPRTQPCVPPPPVGCHLQSFQNLVRQRQQKGITCWKHQPWGHFGFHHSPARVIHPPPPK